MQCIIITGIQIDDKYYCYHWYLRQGDITLTVHLLEVQQNTTQFGDSRRKYTTSVNIG